MIMTRRKIWNVFRWVLTRAGTAYLVFFLVIGYFVDLDMVWKTSRLRSLNRLMPLFDDLAGVVSQGRTLKKEQWKEYIDYYKKVAELIPEDAGPYFFLGFCRAQIGEEKGVIKYFRSAAEKASRIFWFDYNLGMALYNDGQYEEAISWLEKTIADRPQFMRLYMRRSTLFRQVIVEANKQDYNIRKSFDDALKNAYLVIAKSWYFLGNYEKALDVAYYGLSKNSGRRREYYYVAAFSLKALGRNVEAISVLRSILDSYPMDMTALTELESILRSVGQEQAAQQIKELKNHGERLRLKSAELFEREEYKLF